MELNGLCQLLDCAYDVNLFRENINIIKMHKLPLHSSKEVGLEVTAEKTKYVFISHPRMQGKIII
jgi:hypothetical protein